MLRPYPYPFPDDNKLELAFQSGAWLLYTYLGVPSLLVLNVPYVTPETFLEHQAGLAGLIGEQAGIVGEQSDELCNQVCYDVLRRWSPSTSPSISQMVRFESPNGSEGPTVFIDMMLGLAFRVLGPQAADSAKMAAAFDAVLQNLRRAWDEDLPIVQAMYAQLLKLNDDEERTPVDETVLTEDDELAALFAAFDHVLTGWMKPREASPV